MGAKVFIMDTVTDCWAPERLGTFVAGHQGAPDMTFPSCMSRKCEPWFIVMDRCGKEPDQ